MLTTIPCDKCGEEARLDKQILEYDRTVDRMKLVKTSFVYKCSSCGSDTTVEVVVPV